MDDATAIAAIEDQVDFLGQVIDAYQREGFDAGYEKATRDLLACLVLHCEEFLHDQDARKSGGELRRILYEFVGRLERQLDRNWHSHGFVEDGLGI